MSGGNHEYILEENVQLSAFLSGMMHSAVKSKQGMGHSLVVLIDGCPHVWMQLLKNWLISYLQQKATEHCVNIVAGECVCDIVLFAHLKSPLLFVTLSTGQYVADASTTTISICWDVLPREVVTRHSQLPATLMSMFERMTSLEGRETDTGRF